MTIAEVSMRQRPLILLSILFLTLASLASPIEVLHWWTSGGEAKSIGELKNLLEKEGHVWKDFAVAGGAGENAMTVLKTRVVSGNPPASAQIKGPAIQEWANMGVLSSLDDVAAKEHWNKILPSVVQKTMQHKGHYVAVPVNVHRVNWLWVNPKVFEKAGAAVPKTWDEFAVAAEKIQKAGFIPVAHGGQAWQDATAFEAIALGVGGHDFYTKAFVQLDPATLDSPTMQKAFDTFRTYQKYTDKNNSGRDWNLATAMVLDGKAAMQIMGDWAKGEFTNASKVAGKDFLCVAVPSTDGAYTFNIDSFVMFKGTEESKKAQSAMARLILTPGFQTTFNVNKGSIPVRMDADKNKFDLCGKKSMESFASTAKKGTLLPSMAHNMAVPALSQGAMFDVITNFFNSTQSSKDASKALAKAVKANKS